MARVASPKADTSVDAAADTTKPASASTATVTRRKNKSTSSGGTRRTTGDAVAAEGSAGRSGSAIAAAYGISPPAPVEPAGSPFESNESMKKPVDALLEPFEPFVPAPGGSVVDPVNEPFEGLNTSVPDAQAPVLQQQDAVQHDADLQKAFEEISAEARTSPFHTENFAPAYQSVVTMTGTVSSAPELVQMRNGTDLTKFMMRVRRPGTSWIDSCALLFFLPPTEGIDSKRVKQ